MQPQGVRGISQLIFTPEQRLKEMDEMAIDMEQCRIIRTNQDGMRRPNLIEQRHRRGHRPYSAALSGTGFTTPKRSLIASHSSAPTRRNASRTVMLFMGTG